MKKHTKNTKIKIKNLKQIEKKNEKENRKWKCGKTKISYGIK